MENVITLAHGSGSIQTNELINGIFKSNFDNPNLAAADAAVLSLEEGKIAMSIESALHSTYNQQRIRGEWFNLSDTDVAAIIETLK